MSENFRNFEKICVLKGGISTEREISLVSGHAIGEAAKNLGYEVSEFDFTGDLVALLSFITSNNPDCILSGLHGGDGENGNIQALFNMLKIPYTGSGVIASSIAMNKYLTGKLCSYSGIKVPNTKLYNWNEFKENPDFPLPFVIKPVCGGSSCGVFIINNISDLKSIEWIYGETVLVSEYIPGLELSCGVLDSKALELTNIIVKSGFYDYKNKYADGCAIHELPANIPSQIRQEVMAIAEKVHSLLKCRGVSRTDFRYNDVTGEVYMLEINTLPGMTKFSLVPEQAKYVGISFEELVNKLIQEADYDRD